MLVLKRRSKETVVITTPDGTRVIVTSLGMERGRTKLGFEAPEDYTINRGEVQDAIDRKAATEGLE